MIKLIANPKKIESMREDERVIIAIELIRIVSVIRYNNIIQLKMMNDKDYDVSFHFYLIINHAASLFEGIETFFRLGSFLKDLESFKKNIEKIKNISRKERGKKDSFYNLVLRPIRNEIAYHFQKDVLKKHLIDYLDYCIKNKEQIVLISGSTELIKDMRYNITDNVVINYTLDKIADKDCSIKEKIKRFSKALVELSSSFLEILEDLIPELFSDFGLYEKD